MPHILVAGKIHAAGMAVLKASNCTYDVVEDTAPGAYVPLLPKAEGLVLRTQPLTVELVAMAPHLRIVSRHGVGYDAVDVKALSARKIPLAIVGDVNSRAVAEHTLALMLAVARQVVSHDQAVRSGGWAIRNRFETVELDGKTLLLYGFGRIGRGVARLAQAFGMKVESHDPFVGPEAMAALGVTAVADPATALPRADYVSLHVPASPKGAVVGAAELALMKPTAILINAARGGLIDEAALDAALRAGRLYGAGLDVFVSEPPQASDALLTNDRLVISPHSAGLTDECAARMAISAVQNVLDHFAGRIDPRLVINAREAGLAP